MRTGALLQHIALSTEQRSLRPHPDRSRAEHGISKDGVMHCGLWPSFGTRPSKSAVADFDTIGAEVRQA
jgi:hypothetical protein